MVEDFSRPIRQRTASRPGSQRVRPLGRVEYPDTVRLSTRCDRGPVAVRSHDEKMRPVVRPPILRARREPVGGEGFAGGVEPGNRDDKREIRQTIERKSFAESGDVQPCSRWAYPTAGGNVFERGQAVFGKGWSVCGDS